MLNRNQTLSCCHYTYLTIHERGINMYLIVIILVFGGVHVAQLLVFCVVFYVLLVFVLCLVYPMLPISLDCPFLIAPSVFSNVYLFCLLVFVLCLVYPMLPVSLDCPFLVAPSVLPNVY